MFRAILLLYQLNNIITYFVITTLGLLMFKKKYLPCVVKGPIATQSLIDIYAHQLTDELLGIIADLVPVRRVKFEFT
jgi:hypothetical protein